MKLIKEGLRRYAQSSRAGKILWHALSRVKAATLNDSKKRHLPKGMSASDFFALLARQNCRYVVLRWFENLPKIDIGEDLDLLIDDEHTELIDKILVRSAREGGIPCDVYSVSGITSFTYKGIAYYPPQVAEAILANAVVHTSGAKVPSVEHYFLSLTFHALYHKGYKSGLPVSESEAPRWHDPEHDYATILADLARSLGWNVAIDMRSLDRLLGEKGWRPPIDMLERLGHDNEWCRELTLEALSILPHIRGLAVFVIREQAAEAHDLELIADFVRKEGFEVILTQTLTAEQQNAAKKTLRGGNWGHAKSVMDGGLPAAVCVAYDPAPLPPETVALAKAPMLDNQRVVRVKLKIRDHYFKHVVHSTDNARQAAHYLTIIGADEADSTFIEIRRRIGALKQ